MTQAEVNTKFYRFSRLQRSHFLYSFSSLFVINFGENSWRVEFELYVVIINWRMKKIFDFFINYTYLYTASSLFFLLYDVFYDCAMSSFFWDNLFEHHHRVIIASDFFNRLITYFKEKPRRIALIELYRYWNNRLLWLCFLFIFENFWLLFLIFYLFFLYFYVIYRTGNIICTVACFRIVIKLFKFDILFRFFYWRFLLLPLVLSSLFCIRINVLLIECIFHKFL